MKIKTGDSSLPLSPWGRIEYVCVDTGYRTGRGIRLPMIQVSNAEMIELRSKAKPTILGIPMYYSAAMDKLNFFPASSGDFDIYVRFYGPLQEI